jgi:small subunit ribosomal protein S17
MAKSIIGTVSSSKADKTIVVTVQIRKTHPIYRKQYSVTKKYIAHDEKNEAQNGDKVEIVETRPISARKHHSLARIIEKPALREDSLAITKADDVAKPASKSKVADPETKEEDA